MRATSAEYAPFSQVRQVDALISFEVLAKTLNKKDISVVTAPAKLGNGAVTINGIPELAKKYATTEKYGWPLDGSCSVMPDTNAETGFWSSDVSNDNGYFSSPLVFRYDLPSDTVTFGWTFHFDAPAEVRASQVRAEWFDANGNSLGVIEGHTEGAEKRTRPYVKAEIVPVQSFNGHDRPWAPGAGKNLYNKEDGDSSFRYNVTTGKIAASTNTKSVFIPCEPNTTYTVSKTAGSRFYVCYTKELPAVGVEGYGNIANNTGSTITITTGEDAAYLLSYVWYKTEDSATISEADMLASVQIEKGASATEYEPYANICPITGWTGAEITVYATPDTQDGETYSVNFPAAAGTVYGGTLDAMAGVLTVTHGQIASYNGETLPGEWISDRDAYAAGTSPTVGAQVVYELAAPLEYQTEPAGIDYIAPGSYILADCGPVTADIPGDDTVITSDEYGGWSLQRFAENYTAVEFTFYGTNVPLRMLRLAEVDFGISKHFSRDSIKAARIKYGMAPDASAFPAKEIIFTFDNSNGDFNVLNPVGVYQYWRNGQVLVARLKVGDEIVPMGMFYVTKAEIGENRLLAKVTAHDPCYQLANQKFYPLDLAEETSVRLDEAVPRALIGTDLDVDYGGLEAEQVSVAVRDTHDKRVILRYLAQAARATCWIDRDNVLRFRRIVTAEEEDGQISADELYDWSGVSIAEEYTGVTLTVRRELEETEGGGEVTETYHAGVADDSGMAVAMYENPCVAASNGEAVAAWLLTMANRRKKYAVKNRCDPAVEIGDTLVIADAFHNDDRAVITGLDIEYDGGLSCVTEADREF